MIIHVVKQGETIYSIAADYEVAATRLVEENALTNPENLAVGQTIVITEPSQIYIAEEGDTLGSIAEEFEVTRMQLLRNNPHLYNREMVYQGEMIIISYDSRDYISINAYAYPFIDRDILRKTLPFLTYLTIFNYRSLEGGDIVGNDETEVIQISKAYGVAPLMSLSTLTYQGFSDMEVTNSILYNDVYIERHINNTLSILREKGYYGLNISIVNLNQENRLAYEAYISKLSQRLKAEGYVLILTLSPRIILNTNEVAFERIDYTVLGQYADGIMILSYGWGTFAGPPSPSTPVYLTRQLLDNAVRMIPPEKINIGISVIGYDWPGPYVLGKTRANALTTDAAVELAVQTGSTIYFDSDSYAPYFEYIAYEANKENRHVVWFSDARTVDALIELVPEFGIQGVGIWNIMHFFAQLWLVINSQFNINKVYQEF